MGSYEQTMLKLEKMAQANTATQMNWQQKMSDTSHQREVKDLIAAGLNPVLSSGGSGAQSYTTSVDSAVNGIAGMASAREGANATRYAAQQQAAATKAAAAAQVQAAYIAAEASKWNTAHSKTGTVAGIVSNVAQDLFKAFKKGNLGATLNSLTKSILNKSQNVDPSKYLHNPDKAFSWKNMNYKGISLVNKQMKQYDVARTRRNQDIFIDAFYNHNRSSMTKWIALVRAANKTHTSANHLNRLYNY